MTGRLEAIWLKRAHRGPMDPVPEATAVAGKGLAGDVTTSRRHQVTVAACVCGSEWGGGVFAQALDDGIVTIGDAVVLEPADPATSSPPARATR